MVFTFPPANRKLSSTVAIIRDGLDGPSPCTHQMAWMGPHPALIRWPGWALTLHPSEY